MNLTFTLRRAALLLLLALPGLCWGFSGGNALIVYDDTIYASDENAVVAFLSGRLTNAGYTVTTNTGVPGGSLASYQQIWDVRFDTALIGSDNTAYITYLAAGGSLFVMGENGACCGIRDASIITLITAAGGGTLTLEAESADTQTVEPPFTGPVSLSTVTYAAVGGFTSLGRGAFITEDTNTTGGAIVFGPGTLTNATSGALLSVLDVNFLDTTYEAGVSQALTDNLIAYLAAPTVISSSPPGTPAPPSMLLVLAGLAAAGIYLAGLRWLRRGVA